MSDWARVTYGDPCRECGYRWSLSDEEATAIVAGLPERYAALLAGSDGSQRHPDLSWPAGSYVSHVADNLRIWAERLAAAALGADRPTSGYHTNDLSRAREYDSLPLQGALWSLRRAIGDWQEAVGIADAAEVVLDHHERGRQTVSEVVRTNAHDGYHHAWDIACCVGEATRTGK